MSYDSDDDHETNFRAKIEDDPDARESVTVRGSKVTIISPHGGYIEHPTWRMGQDIADELGANWWGFWGPGPDAFDTWHVTSTQMSAQMFPKLADFQRSSVGAGCALSISLHGHSGDDVVVGGRARLSVREAVGEELEAIGMDSGVEVVGLDTDSGDYADIDGTARRNVTNWLTATGDDGVQIELTQESRDDHESAVNSAIVAAVESVIEP